MKQAISRFWIRWLMGVSAILILLGGLLAFTPLVHSLVAPMYYNNFFTTDAYAALSDGARNFQTFVYGAAGAAVMSWGFSMLMIAHTAFRRGQRWAWLTISMSVLLWFAGDSYASVVTGFPIHALINISFLILLGLPMVATYRQFFDATPGQKRLRGAIANNR